MCGVGVAAVVALSCKAYTDWSFVDAHTGSRKGYREWVVGPRSGSWYETSSLESFMRAHHPESLSSRWISYDGTGRTLIGMVRSRGHGRPGIIYSLTPSWIDLYCKMVSDADKLHLYRVLSSHDEDAAKEMFDEEVDTVTSGHQDGIP